MGELKHEEEHVGMQRLNQDSTHRREIVYIGTPGVQTSRKQGDKDAQTLVNDKRIQEMEKLKMEQRRKIIEEKRRNCKKIKNSNVYISNNKCFTKWNNCPCNQC